jgi:hypothetical protein
MRAYPAASGRPRRCHSAGRGGCEGGCRSQPETRRGCHQPGWNGTASVSTQTATRARGGAAGRRVPLRRLGRQRGGTGATGLAHRLRGSSRAEPRAQPAQRENGRPTHRCPSAPLHCQSSTQAAPRGAAAEPVSTDGALRASDRWNWLCNVTRSQSLATLHITKLRRR